MIPVLIDCDPGQDDAIALLLALASPELAVLGVSTVAGNQTLDKVTANAIRVLELAGRGEVPSPPARTARSPASSSSQLTPTGRRGWTGPSSCRRGRGPSSNVLPTSSPGESSSRTTRSRSSPRAR